MAAETKKTEWTEEDKTWAIGGGVVAVGGLLYWWYKSKQDKDDEALAIAGTDTAYIDETATNVVIGSGTNPGSSNTSGTATTPVATNRQPDAIRWKVGQIMMANSKAGTKAYNAKKMANGQYTSDQTLAKTFPIGDKIGKIVWVGAYADGTFRYVIEVDGTFTNNYYWIADYRVITPIDGSKAISTTTQATSSLNTTLVLKKGSKGLEVSELQKRLGIKIDGDFGRDTLTALQTQKGVSQITLANFASTKVTLNFNLMLKQGSKGLEVIELQKRLGFKPTIAGYGTFGPQTESALFAMKGVKQTSLNQFSYV